MRVDLCRCISNKQVFIIKAISFVLSKYYLSRRKTPPSRVPSARTDARNICGVVSPLLRKTLSLWCVNTCLIEPKRAHRVIRMIGDCYLPRMAHYTKCYRLPTGVYVYRTPHDPSGLHGSVIFRPPNTILSRGGYDTSSQVTSSI